MIADLFGSVQYWSILIVGLVVACRILNARLFDFRFMISVTVVQYAAAATVTFGPLSSAGIFCTLFVAIFVATVKLASNSRAMHVDPEVSHVALDGDPSNKLWIDISRFYILGYYVLRLLFYPYIDGALLLDQRLDAQHDNALIFYAGLAVTPAFAACMTKWIQKISLLDVVIIVVAVVGLMGSGSKAVILPVILIFFGVMSYYRVPLRTKAVGIVLAGIGAVLVVVRLAIYFPSNNLADLISLFLLRVVANTDSLEYLYASGVTPDQYPYRGLGALFPMLSKQFGYNYEFSPGVWLHGIRFGDFSGFGPNPGPVIDYFGNLGWFGLIVAALMGKYVVSCEHRKSPIGASFLSIASLIVVDVTLFEVAAVVWICIFAFYKGLVTLGASGGARSGRYRHEKSRLTGSPYAFRSHANSSLARPVASD